MIFLSALLLSACTPEAVQVLALNEDGTYSSGDTIDVVVKLSEPVLVTGTPQLKLSLSGKIVTVPFTRMQSFNGLLFRYSVANGDFTEDLDYAGPTALEMNGATILNLVGMPANVRLPQPGALNSLSYLKNIRIDAFASLIGARMGADLLGSGGIAFTGERAVDRFGNSIAGVGDINADGFDDIAIGAVFHDGAGVDSGTAYILYGKAKTDLSSMRIADLTELHGFKIFRGNCCNNFSSSLAAAGDVNGDGVSDIIVGARLDDVSRTDSGAGYVIYGKAGSTRDNVNVAALENRDGFKILSSRVGVEHLGAAVAGAGDVNKDGFADVLIAAPLNSQAAASAGAVYVIYGGMNLTDVDVNNLSRVRGYAILGEHASDRLGMAGNPLAFADDYASDALTGLGDINNDSIDDFAIGAWFAEEDGKPAESGMVYVVFGKQGARGSFNVSLLKANTDDGFTIQGENVAAYLGAVGRAGDFNHDGMNDLIVGSPLADSDGRIDAGKAYVIWGRAGALRANINLSLLTPNDGMVILGIKTGDHLGASVEGVGDVNGDGIHDIIVAATHADNRLSPTGIKINTGAAFILFGTDTVISQTSISQIDLATLADNGAVIFGANTGDMLGFSVASAGDMNNDDLKDILVGSPLHDEAGVDAGKSYVIFGQNGKRH